MIILNFNNIEEIIFSNKELMKKLNNLIYFYDIWKMARIIPAMRNQGKKAVLDFLLALETKHIEVIESHLGKIIKVERLSYNTIETFQADMDNLECELENHNINNLELYRKDDIVYVTNWR